MENAKITLGILSGAIKDSRRDIVLLNAGAALYVCGAAETIGEGIEKSRESVESGRALDKLHELAAFTNRA